ncbi:MAG: DNA-3-methyladenine glycosylase I [Ornithinimicrobium sp.]
MSEPAAQAEVRAGPDGRLRCPWPFSGGPDYLDYHDHEWGCPVRTEHGLFERLSLEAFQSGLSWLTILRKRPGFRSAFADFDPDRVAAFGEQDVQRLLGDASIVRNRRKILATVTNARATVALRGQGGLAALFWSVTPAGRPRPATMDDVPAHTAQSVALAADLKRAGFAHLGPTTAYAAMQACGLVDDHLRGCFRAEGGPVE